MNVVALIPGAPSRRGASLLTLAASPYCPMALLSYCSGAAWWRSKLAAPWEPATLAVVATVSVVPHMNRTESTLTKASVRAEVRLRKTPGRRWQLVRYAGYGQQQILARFATKAAASAALSRYAVNGKLN